MDKNMINRFVLPEDLKQALDSAEKIIFPKTKAQLVELCYGPNGAARFNVSYDISEKESYVEADVVRCKNGPSVNFTDAYMRRRDPDCMYIGDKLPTDKPKFEDRWGYKFSQLRQETMDWISHQELVVMPFMMGSKLHGYESLVVAPGKCCVLCICTRQYPEIHQHRRCGGRIYTEGDHLRGTAVPPYSFWREAGRGALSERTASRNFFL